VQNGFVVQSPGHRDRDGTPGLEREGEISPHPVPLPSEWERVRRWDWDGTPGFAQKRRPAQILGRLHNNSGARESSGGNELTPKISENEPIDVPSKSPVDWADPNAKPKDRPVCDFPPIRDHPGCGVHGNGKHRTARQHIEDEQRKESPPDPPQRPFLEFVAHAAIVPGAAGRCAEELGDGKLGLGRDRENQPSPRPLPSEWERVRRRPWDGTRSRNYESRSVSRDLNHEAAVFLFKR